MICFVKKRWISSITVFTLLFLVFEQVAVTYFGWENYKLQAEDVEDAETADESEDKPSTFHLDSTADVYAILPPFVPSIVPYSPPYVSKLNSFVAPYSLKSRLVLPFVQRALYMLYHQFRAYIS